MIKRPTDFEHNQHKYVEKDWDMGVCGMGDGSCKETVGFSSTTLYFLSLGWCNNFDRAFLSNGFHSQERHRLSSRYYLTICEATMFSLHCVSQVSRNWTQQSMRSRQRRQRRGRVCWRQRGGRLKSCRHQLSSWEGWGSELCTVRRKLPWIWRAWIK